MGKKKKKRERTLERAWVPGKAGLLSTKLGYKVNSKRGSFVRYSLSTMADSNSCALVIRLRKEKRVVALPKVKFVDKIRFDSIQEVFTDVYDGDLDVRVKCRVGFKKPGDAELKDFVSVDLAENVGASVNALSANFVDFDALDEEPQAKAVKPLNAFDVLMRAASTKILLPKIGAEEQANPMQWVELHNRLLQLAKILHPGAGFPPAEVKSSGASPF